MLIDSHGKASGETSDKYETILMPSDAEIDLAKFRREIEDFLFSVFGLPSELLQDQKEITHGKV